MRLIYFLLFVSSGLLAQGNLGLQFGLNDDNFGSIENIKSKIDNYDLDLHHHKMDLLVHLYQVVE